MTGEKVAMLAGDVAFIDTHSVTSRDGLFVSDKTRAYIGDAILTMVQAGLTVTIEMASEKAMYFDEFGASFRISIKTAATQPGGEPVPGGGLEVSHLVDPYSSKSTDEKPEQRHEKRGWVNRDR